MNIANMYPQPRIGTKKCSFFRVNISQHLTFADPACSKGSASKEKLPAAGARTYYKQQGARSKKQDVRNKEVRNQSQAARGKFWELG